MLVGLMLFVTSYFTGVVAGRVDNQDLLRLLATIHVVGMQIGLCMVGTKLAPEDGSFMLSLLIFGGVLLITAICMFSVFVINLRSRHRASSSPLDQPMSPSTVVFVDFSKARNAK